MLDSLLRPRSIAVVGAGRKPGGIGHELLRNLVAGDFRGPVYPVNPHATAVRSIRAYPSVEALPEAPDLVVVVVPKEHVEPVVRSCAEVGAGGVVVITAGFAEVGPEGARQERRLADQVAAAGMRMVGPNCMGVMNTSAAVSMNATFAPAMPPAGPIAFMSQSGAMGMTILDYASEYGIGVSQFVSVGNKADVSGNDLLEYWGGDDEVGVVLMYLESFGDPRRFTGLARRVTRRKPVIAVKAGRSSAGAKAASSHTGALAQVDIATDALFAQCGVLRVDTVEELFDAASAFGNAPLPEGPRVAVLTNAGGPGILIADACEGAGLEIPPLSPASQEALAAQLPEEASAANPVDMIASATPEQFRSALHTVLEDPGIDAAIAAYVPLGLEAPIVARAIREGAAGSDKPVLAVLMGQRGFPQGVAELREARVPVYRFPESAARALGAMWRHRQWRDRPTGEVREFEVDEKAVERIVGTALEEGRERLSAGEAFAVLEAYGIPVAAHRIVRSEAEAVAAAGAIGYPVVLKAAGPEIVHKTERGLVHLDLGDAEAIGAAWRRVSEGVPEEEGPEVLVQRMLAGGRETIVGMTTEARFGPILMVGLGGVYVEVLEDVAFRVQPVSTVDAAEMIRSLRGFPILEGVRGEPPVHVGTLEEVVQRASQLVGRHPEIVEMDVNPFLMFPNSEECVAVDARFRLEPHA